MHPVSHDPAGTTGCRMNDSERKDTGKNVTIHLRAQTGRAVSLAASESFWVKPSDYEENKS